MSVQSERGAKHASCSAGAELGVRSHTTDHGDHPVSRLFRRLPESPAERVHDGVLVGRGKVGATALQLVLVELSHRVEQGSLDPREGEVEAWHARDREGERLGVAVARQPVELCAAGVAEPEQPCALVEGLPGRVVERPAQDLEARTVGDGEDERVTAAREKARERRLERVRLEVERRDVRAEVVDGDEVETSRPGDRLGGGETDEQRADQPGALRHRDPGDVVEPRLTIVESRSEHGADELQVPSRGDLRHHAAVAGVELRLRGDDRREHDTLTGHHRRGRLVAGRLEAQDQLGHATPSCSSPASRHMMRASSRLSV